MMSDLSTYNLIKLARTEVRKHIILERLLGMGQVLTGSLLLYAVPTNILSHYIAAPVCILHGTFMLVRKITFDEVYSESPKTYRKLVQRVGYAGAKAHMTSSL